jgi:hypothetical protein
MDKTQCGHFHFEVLKKLHSMKSNQSLVELQAEDRPTSDEIENLNLECAKQLNNIDGVHESDNFKLGSPTDFDFNDLTPMNAMKNLSKILQRNKELEDALRIKEMAMQKLLSRNKELEDELKRKEVVRLSQLELLALRNVELEKELHQQSSS